MDIEKKTVRERLVALIAAGALAASMAAMPAMAYAADAEPSAGAQTGTGATALNMIVKNTDEHSETDENVAFTFPSAINYVVAADGTLTGPSGSAAFIQSQSQLPIRVSSVDVDAATDWNFVETEAATASASTNNNVFLNIGPSGHQINAYSHLDKTDITTTDAGSWAMAAYQDQVALPSAGKAGKINKDVTSQQQFGQITWYVKAGVGPTA